MMALVYQAQNVRKLLYISMVSVLSTIVCAKQPLSEMNLAQEVGEQSPAKIKVEQINADADSNLILDELQKQILAEQRQQYYKPLQASLQMNTETLQQKEQVLQTKTHETAEKNFGLEGLSMVWSNDGSELHAIVDLEKISDVSYNSNTREYELNNIRGKVMTVVELD